MLCILGILLFTILCVLFVPVRYRIELNREEGDGKPPVIVRAKITWLWHLVNILIRYPAEKMYVRVRIFCFILFRIPEKTKRKSEHKKRSGEADSGRDNQETAQNSAMVNKDQSGSPAVKGQETKQISKEEKAQETKQDTKQETKPATKQETKPESNQEIHQDTNETAKSQKIKKESQNHNVPTVTIQAQRKEEPQENQPKEKLSWRKKLGRILTGIKNIFCKIIGLFQNIQYTIRHFCDRMKSILNKIEYYREIIASDIFKQSFQLCRDELVSILKTLKPQKSEADLVVGMDDPATTGEILAIWGMLYPLIGEHVNITGDFERNRIEGHVFIKGKIKVITFIKAAIRIYFNKDIKKLIKLLKKEAV